MIFIGGIHGVGKSHFCKIVKETLHINSYSASSLIANLKQEVFNKDKLITNIDGNQPYLLMAVKELNSKGEEFLLDGHFCLLDSNAVVSRIEAETFLRLNPKAIILLVGNPSVIAERRKKRDGIIADVSEIGRFQQEEIIYAREISEMINSPLFIVDDINCLEDVLNFIQQYIKH